ncbi:MAG TPA: hypothetical protein VGO43_14610 [Pyrinomonadaceae bacterium]|nr:hypothetical protein [Pyrinomonadaceae bacterium]
MKLLSLTLVLLSAVGGAAQEKAKLLDEFGVPTCEELLARTDGFRTVLLEFPAATGVVIISRAKGLRTPADRYRTLIDNTLRRADFDSNRVQIFHGEEGSETHGSFWIVPPGAENPAGARELWSRGGIVVDVSKPFMFGSEDETGVCPTLVPRDFARLIKENPSVIGKVIVHPEVKWSPAAIGLPWIERLTKEYSVPRKRLRLIYGKRSKTIGYTEFWLVPSRK